MFGRQLLKLAAELIIPITTSLNTICPCIVEKDADLKTTAKRIILAKFLNSGQYCLAPNYVLVHQQIYFKFREILLKQMELMFEPNNNGFRECGKTINDIQFNRLVRLMYNQSILFGGNYNIDLLEIEPTIIELQQNRSALLLEEILGPILPISPFDFIDDALLILNKHNGCLAHYIFTANEMTAENWIQKIDYGYVGINAIGFVSTNPNLPYNNKGLRGNGVFHGKFGFDTFSIKKSIMKTGYFFDRKYLYNLTDTSVLNKIKKLMK